MTLARNSMPGGGRDPQAPAATWSTAKRRPNLFKGVSVGVTLVLAFLAIYPLMMVLSRIFLEGGQPTLQPIREVLALDDLSGVLLNTAIVVLGSALAALVIAGLLAWLNERTDARMGMFTDALPLVPFLLPPIAGAVGWVLLLSPGAGLLNVGIRDFLGVFGLDYAAGDLRAGPLDIYSWPGLLFVYTLYQVPYAYMMMSAALRNLDPSMEEQARLSGAGLGKVFRTIVLPSIRPSMGAAVLLMLWFGFALFSIPVIIGTGAGIDVLPVRIVQLLAFSYPARTDLAVGLSLVVVLVVGTAWYMQNKILQSSLHATVGGKSHRQTLIPLGRLRTPARAFMVGYVFVVAVLPLLALVLVTLNGYWSASIDWGRLDFDAVTSVVMEDGQSRDALINSLQLGIVGATLGIVAAAIVSLYVKRSDRFISQLADASIKLPAAVSSVVIAVGFALAFSGDPFNLQGTWLILLLAYVALYIPQASVAADAGASQLGSDLVEASQISGASASRTFARVSLPIMWPSLLAGWSLLFVRMTGDLTASAILAGTANPVIGRRILDVYINGGYAELAALACVVTVITMTVLILVMWLSRARERQMQHGTVKRRVKLG